MSDKPKTILDDLSRRNVLGGMAALGGAAMLAGVPFAFALDLDAGAVDEEVQWAGSAAIRQAHVQRSLTAAKGAVVRHCPIKSDQP